MVSIRNSYRPDVVRTVQGAMNDIYGRRNDDGRNDGWKRPVTREYKPRLRGPLIDDAKDVCERPQCGKKIEQKPNSQRARRFCSRVCAVFDIAPVGGVSGSKILEAIPFDKWVTQNEIRLSLGIPECDARRMRERIYSFKRSGFVVSKSSGKGKILVWKRASEKDDKK